MKHNATYEYVSGGSPVIMKERVNGLVIAEYTAYIDRSGYVWTLYPKRQVITWSSVPFEKKKVHIRFVTVLPKVPLSLSKPSPKTNPLHKTEKQKAHLMEQMKLF